MKIIDGKDLADKKFILLDDGTLKEYKASKFTPKEGETFYYISMLGNIERTVNYSEASRFIIVHNYVFRTEEECECYKHFLDMVDKYKADFTIEVWNDTDIDKYYLYYSLYEKKVETAHSNDDKYDCLYFRNLESAERFIDEAGEENIKKFLFDIWE